MATAAVNEQLLTIFFGISMIFSLIALFSSVILIWFRKAVFDELKFRKLMKFGYVVCRLKRYDKTEKEIVTIPDKKTNSVKFPGVEGIYTIDDASVVLRNRKHPVYEWSEGETAPINHNKEYVTTNVACPGCNLKFNANVLTPKSINPSVLDNLILKIKMLSALPGLNKMFLICIVCIGIVAIIMLFNTFWLDDFKKRVGEIIWNQIGTKFTESCREAVVLAKTNVSITI
jgi:hypothetical protein